MWKDGKEDRYYYFEEDKIFFLIGPVKVIGSFQCDQKKLRNIHKSCPKMISLEKWMILTALQTLPKNVGDFGKLIVVKGFKNLPKVQ